MKSEVKWVTHGTRIVSNHYNLLWQKAWKKEIDIAMLSTSYWQQRLVPIAQWWTQEREPTYVSHMVILTRRLSTFICLTLKSTPMVGCIGSKISSVNRSKMLLFPTPLSPTSKILKVSSNSISAAANKLLTKKRVCLRIVKKKRLPLEDWTNQGLPGVQRHELHEKWVVN